VFDIAGLADNTATVVVSNQIAQRQGEHWFKQLIASGDNAL
jgi:hypothetical protein